MNFLNNRFLKDYLNKIRISILRFHKCLDKGNKSVCDHCSCFIVLYLGERILFSDNGMPGKFIWKKNENAYAISKQFLDSMIPVF